MNGQHKSLMAGIVITMAITTGCSTASVSSPPTGNTVTSVSPSSAMTNNTVNSTLSSGIDQSSPSNNTASNTNSTSNTTAVVSGSKQSGFTGYTNSRFGFSLRVPSIFTHGTPPADGDGMVWTSSDHSSQIQAFGSYNVQQESLQSVLKSNSPSGHITYEDKGPNWAVESGTTGSDIFYRKVFVSPTYIYQLNIQYPKSAQSQYGTMVSTVSKSFQPGSLK